jgi:3-oxoacyl-[acyl-carrier protein] reductase
VQNVALITGASRGIGQAIALALGKAGYTVAGTGTSAASAQGIDSTFRDLGISGKGLVLNVGSTSAVDDLMQVLKADGLMPSVLVNNAGVTQDMLLLRMKDEEWEQVININLTSMFRLSKAVLRDMMKARFGRIVNITSVVGQTGSAGQCNYAAAKAGIIGFTKALAREVGSRAITVNAVAPGFIETDMTRALPEARRAELLSQIPLGRLGSADDVAAAVRFLVSEEAGYITGETLSVNGGLYMA